MQRIVTFLNDKGERVAYMSVYSPSQEREAVLNCEAKYGTRCGIQVEEAPKPSTSDA